MTRREWAGRAAAGLAAGAVGCRRTPADKIGDPDDTLVSASAVDYATARRGFRTRLARQGPAPGGDTPLPATVPGAVPIPYESSGLRLVGWANPEVNDWRTKRPAVLFLHGGFSFEADHWEYARPFLKARTAFHVLLPVLRAESGQPGAFSLFYDEVDDVLAATDALSRLPGVDAGRLFVAGHGAGGTLALLAVLATDRFRACAAFAPVADLRWAVRRGIWGRDLPFDPGAEEEYTMRSPLAFAAHFNRPVRVFHGDRGGEPAVAAVSNAMGDHARRNSKDVGELTVPGDHTEMVAPAAERTVGFFEASGAK